MAEEADNIIHVVDTTINPSGEGESKSPIEDLVMVATCLTPVCPHGILRLLYTDGPVSNQELMAHQLDHVVIHGKSNIEQTKAEKLNYLMQVLQYHFDEKDHDLGLIFITSFNPSLGPRGGQDSLRNLIEASVGL